MAYRLKLSDGTTTIDLYGGNAQVMDGGLDIRPPQPESVFNNSTYADGGALTANRYKNRTIVIRLVIARDSLANLKTTIRGINSLLNDAEKRSILGYGAQVYLEYQWGDTADQSTFFDVYRGTLALPANYLANTLNKFAVINATLTLECKPFGRYTNQDIAQDTLENSQSAYEVQTSFLTGEDASNRMDAANDWECQTFTPGSNYTATQASILCYIIGAPGTTTFAIYATDGAGKPTGAALASGTVSADTMTVDTTYCTWLTCSLGAGTALVSGTVYALVVHGTGFGVGNSLDWKCDTAPGYAGGQRVYSTDGGSSWTTDATRDFLFAVYSSETKANYQDVTTLEGHGDVPARMYWKLAQSGATGSEKIWVAKRSGTRQTDDLWLEGEEYSTTTLIKAPAPNDYSIDGLPEAALSGGRTARFFLRTNGGAGGTIGADEDVLRANYTIATVPKGHFRVLIRAKAIAQDAADYDHLGFGIGYSYGGKTYAPTEALSEYYACAADSTWEILDLGDIILPPLPESDIATNASFELRLFCHAIGAITVDENYYWEWDYIFLLPVDEGAVIINSVASTDNIAIDSITDPPNVFLLSTNTINSFPDRTGAAFTLGRESTRVYILRDDVKAVTFASDLKYQPQFIHI